MKKRIFSIMLTLIMLVSLVPATALTASAAGLSTSEKAITVLKQLEGYSKTCNANGYIGYGMKCPEKAPHGTHTWSEIKADEELRAKLKELDKAVNKFSGSLSQGQHDALVLFSFKNGTAWTSGTGAFQNAIKSGAKGSEFLDAICRWNASTDDDNRRKIEAHMYLNTQYNAVVQNSRYRTITFAPNGGKIGNQTVDVIRYFDTAVQTSIDVVPTKTGYTFMGWYNSATAGKQITSLKGISNGGTLTAQWQSNTAVPTTNGSGTLTVNYETSSSSQVRLYDVSSDNKFITSDYTASGKMTISNEFIDKDNVRWGRVTKVAKLYNKDKLAGEDRTISSKWIKLGEVSFSGSTGSATTYTMDVTVSVTNEYVRIRSKADIYSGVVRQAKFGEQLRIVNTASNGGILWGQLADNQGWVALLYTNFEDVRGNDGGATYNVVASATIVKPVNGYVNVRSGAGTNNSIVGALPYQSHVNLYEIDYVNGIQWGRYDGGWFCLSYADVVGIDVDDYVNSSNVLNYAFPGKMNGTPVIYTHYRNGDVVDQDQLIADKKLKAENKIVNGSSVTVTNLTEYNGETWGKIALGWVRVSDADGGMLNVDLNVAKFYTVVEGVTVRETPSTGSARKDNLVKGVEFNVNQSKQVIVIDDTIWGYTDKVGEDDPNTPNVNEGSYSGWINLASKYVARGDAPTSVPTNKDNTYTNKMATIVNADKVNVRGDHDIYGKLIGKIARGTTVPVLGYEDGWYMLDYEVDNNPETDSWVNEDYVQITTVTVNNGSSNGSAGTGSGTVETGMGIVANTYGGVNVRTGVGTGYPATGKLLPGTAVEILEVTTHGTSKWGRTAQGWVCMDYITMVTNYEILAGLTGGNGSTGGSTVTGSETAIYTGTVSTATVYQTTSTKSDVVRTITNGNVTVHEIMTVIQEEVIEDSDTKYEVEKTTEYWVRVNDGYINLDTDTVTLDTLDEAVYTVTESEFLNVRQSAGTSNTSLFKLKKGAQVVITKLEIVNGAVWGRAEGYATEVTGGKDENGDYVYNETWGGDGWISLAYCTKGAIDVNPPVQNTPPVTQQPTIGAGSTTGGFVNNATGYRYTGKVINTNKVNVRATASQTATKTTELAQGASLVIYETVTSEGMAWGRCDAGWVYLYYVDLTPVVNGAVDARVVYNENTIAYTDMDCSEVAGTYSKMAVIDIYEIVGKMARTELGWVNTDNLL